MVPYGIAHCAAAPQCTTLIQTTSTCPFLGVGAASVSPFRSSAGVRYDEDEEEFDYAWRYGLRRLVSPVRRMFGLGSSRRRRRYIIDDEDEDVIEVMSDGDSDKERPTWYRRALRGVALPVRRVLRGRNRLVDSDEDSDREVVVVTRRVSRRGLIGFIGDGGAGGVLASWKMASWKTTRWRTTGCVIDAKACDIWVRA